MPNNVDNSPFEGGTLAGDSQRGNTHLSDPLSCDPHQGNTLTCDSHQRDTLAGDSNLDDSLFEPAQAAEALLNMARSNESDELRRVFRRHRSLRLKSSDLTLYCADRFLKLNAPDHAEKLLDDRLAAGEESFALLELLGRVDEVRGEMISAFDTYRRAAVVASTAVEQKQIRAALARVKRYTYCETVFHQDRFTIALEGNRHPLRFQFRIDQMEKRRSLLEAIMRSAVAEAQSAIEIECDGGLITRSLHALGFRADGIAEKMTDISLALGFEYAEMLKSGSYRSPDYHRLRAEELASGAIGRADLILLLPPRLSWYEKRGAENAAALIADLYQLSRKQLFFYLPLTEKGGSEGFFTWNLLTTLSKELEKRDGLLPVLTYTSASGELLYRIDKPGFETGRGPASDRVPAIGKNSEVITVELSKMVSAGGFGYSEKDWNPFREHLAHMLAESDTPYQQSALKRFYEHFRPQNRQEQLFGVGAETIAPLNRGWTLMPWEEPAGRHPNPLNQAHLPGGGWLEHGPNKDQFGALISRKLIQAYSRLSLYGYRPEIFPDGYIRGYLLRDGDDYRFLISKGFHRLTAAALLDYPELKVKLNSSSGGVIDLNEINDWPGVKSGLYSPAVARKVFRRFFSPCTTLIPGEDQVDQ